MKKAPAPAEPPAKKKTRHAAYKAQRYSNATIIAALKTTHGNIAAAKRLLRCDWRTIRNKVAASPELSEALREVIEDTKDLAENALVEMIRDKDFQAIRYFLNAKAKDRGYGQQPLSDANGDPIEGSFAAPIIHITVNAPATTPPAPA